MKRNHTEESKRLMSEAKLLFYKSDKGILLKKKLSAKAVREHQTGQSNIGRVKGLYPSKKMKKLLSFSSSYELRSHYLIDNDPKVKSYECQLPININGRNRCLDFIIEHENGVKTVIEVKPYSRIQQCLMQINDCRDYANTNGLGFEIWSEQNCGFNNSNQITEWAISYITNELHGIDLAIERRQRRSDKVMRHYRKYIANNKTNVNCNYCNCVHEVLKLSYQKNVNRNGRYVCSFEGGHLIGSRPKSLKENPYAVDGKKHCNCCNCILDTIKFGIDKQKRDGLSTQCKACRAKKSKQAYHTK